MIRLAVCAIFKNEAPYLLEWIACHHAVGVMHFFLYDNDSTDGGAELIRQSPLAGLVTLTQWPVRPGQLPAYSHYIEHYAAAHDWVAFIDVDEFILPLNDATIGAVLERRRDFAAVLVHWRVFGPSGHAVRPAGLVLENYIMRTPDGFSANRHIKSIVRCADLLDVTHNPHEFVLRGATCNAAGRAVPNIAIQPIACYTDLVINHYQTRSRQDWAEKIARGSAMYNAQEPKYPADLIDHYETESTVQDVAIQRFLPQIRAKLGMPAPAGWVAEAPQGYQHADAKALAFCDLGRPGAPWLAALRGSSAAGRVDPDFLTDEAGRIREFPSFEAASAALRLTPLPLGEIDAQRRVGEVPQAPTTDVAAPPSPAAPRRPDLSQGKR